MNSRKPTKAESIYVQAAINAVGCYACMKLGHPNDYEPEYLAIHHNPEKGSTDKLAHFFTVPLCGVHHQGAVPAGMKLPEGEPVRHPVLRARETVFKTRIGSDLEMCRDIWSRLSLDAIDAIGEITGIYSFEELIRSDQIERNNRPCEVDHEKTFAL